MGINLRQKGITFKGLTLTIADDGSGVTIVKDHGATALLTINSNGFKSEYGFQGPYSAAKTASYEMEPTDFFCSFSGSTTMTGSNIITASLPPVADGTGRFYTLAKADNITASFIHVIPSGSDVLYGNSSNGVDLWSSGSSATFSSDGTYWFLTGHLSGSDELQLRI